MSQLRLATIFALLIGAGALMLSAAPADAQEGAALERGRELTNLLFSGQTDTLHAMMAEPMRRIVGGAEGLRAFAAQVRALGTESEIVLEDAVALGATTLYDRIARFPNLPGNTVTIHWAWQAGRIVAASVRPTPSPARSTYLDYRTRGSLRLPFEGEWTVTWGGREPHRNYHVVHPDQRFAYDLLIYRDGSTHTGDGSRNSDYHCFGEPILAPAAGRITAAVDTLPDNAPGAMLPAAPAGNHVIIDHGHEEYSLLAHLQSGSVAVRAGELVEAGDTIGACGNSGNTSEPHLHYHLQNAPAFGQGEGLPAFFHDYYANDRAVARGEPVRGDRVRPQPR